MTVIYVYHTPHVASPTNDRRAGTYRVSSDNPNPIQVAKGWDAVVYFAFRNYNQQPCFIAGRTVTARIYNTENVEVWNGPMIADVLVEGTATLIMNSAATGALSAGLYSLVIEYTDDQGRILLAKTGRSLPRFILEVIDNTTISLNI
jgi:hypothetical protein